MLGVIAGASPALCDEVTQCALRNTFEEAADALERNGVPISVKRVRTISQHYADTALALRQKRMDEWRELHHVEAVPDSWAGLRVAIGIDGGRVNIRTSKRGRRKNGSGGRGFHAEWREPKIFTAYIIDEKGRRKSGTLSICDGTLRGPDELIDMLALELQRHNAGAASQIVILADGAPWIWNRIDELLLKAGIPAERVVRVLDFYHAVEHLATMADAIPGLSSQQRTRWLNRMKSLLKTSAPERFLEELSRSLPGRHNKILRREWRYFQTKSEAIHYCDFAARALPIGSGAVESAIRRIVNLRLKGAGMFWLHRNAEGFLHLRSQLMAGRWKEHLMGLLDAVSKGKLLS